MNALMAMLLLAAFVALGPGAILLNRQAGRVFSYMAENHHADWVTIGSPTRLPGFAFGMKEPALSFLLDKAYEQSADPELVRQCYELRRY